MYFYIFATGCSELLKDDCSRKVKHVLSDSCV